jgi:hypothetical protein
MSVDPGTVVAVYIFLLLLLVAILAVVQPGRDKYRPEDGQSADERARRRENA